jgi:rubrerythrin
MKKLINRIREWLRHRRIMRACDESAKRMATMTRDERRELGERALSVMYPEGHWNCNNHGDLIFYRVPNGQRCPVCNSSPIVKGPLTTPAK